ncbi:MAG: class I SAM-dependent methyltransferase [Sphingomonas sp.]
MVAQEIGINVAGGAVDADVADPCPVCGAAEAPFYRRGIVHRHYPIPGLYETRRCDACTLEWVSPALSDAQIASFYPEEYYAHQGTDRPSRWSRLVAFLGADVRSKEPKLERSGRMLDIGCGNGAALRLYSARGWEAVGVNFSGNPKDYEQRVLIGKFSDIDFGSETFDYVRLNHTLEHLPDPVESVRKISEITKEGSTLFIAVPNARSWAYKLFGGFWWNYGVPCHLFVFNRASLTRLLADNGFEITAVREASDFAAITGSLQMWLNRKNGRPSNDGFVFRSKLLRIAAHGLAKVMDLFATGDCIEVTAVRRGASV